MSSADLDSINKYTSIGARISIYQLTLAHVWEMHLMDLMESKGQWCRGNLQSYAA